jgi:cell division transport system ATP-binding protein
MIEAKHISLTYKDGTVALKDVNLTINRGDMVYITGPSGSGKTSLLKLFMGMEYITSGKLEVSGIVMAKDNTSSIRNLRKKIGPVFQEFKLIEGRTVLENVMMGMRFLGVSPNKMKDDAKEALTRVGLGHKISAAVEHLSWGEAQRVAIARAVARKPELIIADEPTGNLDNDNAMNILALLSSFCDQNTTVVLTTHATHLIDGNENATYIRVKSGDVTVERRDKYEDSVI